MLYTFALERLAPLDDWYRYNAAEALDVYPSRSIYALFLILTRLELMKLDPEEKRCADLLLLTALDEAHILRGHAHSTRLRPRSLQPPAEYREVNIWRVIEKAAEEWSLSRPPGADPKVARGRKLGSGNNSNLRGNRARAGSAPGRSGARLPDQFPAAAQSGGLDPFRRCGRAGFGAGRPPDPWPARCTAVGMIGIGMRGR